MQIQKMRHHSDLDMHGELEMLLMERRNCGAVSTMHSYYLHKGSLYSCAYLFTLENHGQRLNGIVNKCMSKNEKIRD